MSVVTSAPRANARPSWTGPLRAGHLSKLDMTVRRRVEGLLSGDYRAAAIGEGTELAPESVRT